MDIVTYAAAVKKAKRLIDEIEQIEPATPSKLGGIKVGSNLSVTNDGTVSVNVADKLSINDQRPVASSATAVELGHVNQQLENLVDYIKSITDVTLVVKGRIGNSTGKANAGYNQISLATIGDGAPLGDFTLAMDVVGGYGIARYAFLVLHDERASNGVYNKIKLGALYSLDTVNHIATFALGDSVAKIDASANLTIE